MVLRKIVKIDEELCDGCGQCIPNCAEGALQIIDGKARLVSEVYCDGLGACLGHCPRGAITIEEREADPFNEAAVHAHLTSQAHPTEEPALECGCPSTTVQTLEGGTPTPRTAESALRHWPVQLRLVPIKAPFFDDADLLVAADCVPFAYPDLHGTLLAGRSVVIGCPKFDDARGYAEKLGEILKQNDVRRVTVVHMEVPCCSGLDWIIGRAMEASGKQIPVRRHVVTVRGELQEVER